MKKFFWRHPGWSVFLALAFVIFVFFRHMSFPVIVAPLLVAFITWLLLFIMFMEFQNKFITFIPIGESGRVIKVVNGRVVEEAQCIWGKEGKESGVYKVPQLDFDDHWRHRAFNFILILRNGLFERMEIPINIAIQSSERQPNTQEVYDHVIKLGFKNFDELIKRIIFEKDVVEPASAHMLRFISGDITYREYVSGITYWFFKDKPQEFIKDIFSIFEKVEITIDFKHQRYISKAVSA
jgi:hypothetical protein